MAGFAPAAVVEGAPRRPLPYGLFDVVSFAPAATERWENGVTWEQVACGQPGIIVAGCDEPTPQKVFADAPGWGEADAFTVYGSYNCTPIGNDLQHAEDLALAHLEAHEQSAAERGLWDAVWGKGPTTLGGGTPQTWAVAIALLEQHLATEYGSLGVIHVSRYVGSLLTDSQIAVGKDGRMATKLGTPVVVGAGYPGTGEAGATPTVGAEWALATPGLLGYRSEVFTSSLRPGDLLDTRTNDLYAVAERNYLIGFDDCGPAAVQVLLEGN